MNQNLKYGTEDETTENEFSEIDKTTKLSSSELRSRVKEKKYLRFLFRFSYKGLRTTFFKDFE